jgi:DNA-binding MarR family transcriptional regulator
MPLGPETFSELRRQLDRVVNLYGRLVSRPVNFGLGEPIHPSEMHLLEAVGEGRGDSVTKMAEHLGITKGAVSQTANKLHLKGYLLKERGGESGKEVVLSLSRKGASALRAHAEAHAGMEARLKRRLAEVPERDILAFARLLALLESQLAELTDIADQGGEMR